MVFRRKYKLEERLTLLEEKYEQLARELGRVEKDIIKIFRELESIKRG